MIFCTGLGAVDPPLGNGIPASLHRTVSPVTVIISPSSVGDLSAAILFDGMAPGFVGLYQVNVRVPPFIPSGAHSLKLIIGGVTSNTISIAVQ